MTIVATVQVYNAAVERVFSPLTFVQSALVNNTLREMVELKALVCCIKVVENNFD